MEPTSHYRTFTYLWYTLWTPGGLLWVAAVLGFVPYEYSGLAIPWLAVALLAGLQLPRLIPARCPNCGVRRAYIFREQVAEDSLAVKYRCRSCGHVQDTGQVEAVGGE
ncbi:hypothetical protein [Paludisphaera soli]|uniref:hypothetical protein n=1 Tax=Paludisphaera soli TaxID=2712865 RepID=UPI0013E9B3E9|nr:hypothetical protein [Paludisphaera soli]